MWLVYEGDKEASGFKVLNLVISLGVPKTIGRVHRKTWGVEFTHRTVAEDALWVLQRHTDASANVMGNGSGNSQTRLPNSRTLRMFTGELRFKPSPTRVGEYDAARSAAAFALPGVGIRVVRYVLSHLPREKRLQRRRILRP